MTSSPSAPKLFISYCSSSVETQEWVTNLAQNLSNDGVHVIYDLWDLGPGQDAFAFMEQIVRDDEIKKVVLICDSHYVKRANEREHGVGTEAQIISPKIYADTSQTKFVAVVLASDQAGKALVPIYYTSNIYIDFRSEANSVQSYEKLLRWILDKPSHQRPPIGKVPAHIADPAAPSLGLGMYSSRAVDALRNSRPNAFGLLDEYLDRFIENMPRFRIPIDPGPVDDAVVRSIDASLPARNEFCDVLGAVLRFGDVSACVGRLHRFFERLYPYTQNVLPVSEGFMPNSDNYRFLVHEFFLVTVASFVHHEKFEDAERFLEKAFYLRQPGLQEGGRIGKFAEFCLSVSALEDRKRRLKSSRVSLHADMLKSRSPEHGVTFSDLMQADCICYIRSLIVRKDRFETWWPETLVYAASQFAPLEVFARCASRTYYRRMYGLLGIKNDESSAATIASVLGDSGETLSWGGRFVSVKTLIGADQLGTMP